MSMFKGPGNTSRLVSYKSRTVRIVFVLVFLSSFLFPPSLNAKGMGCDQFYEEEYEISLYGEILSDESESVCRPMVWRYEKFNDGFAKYFSIYMESDTGDLDEDLNSTNVQIYCDKRKIEVYVWVEYADSFGWSGTGQVRFDSGAPKKFSYLLQRDFDGIYLKDAKTFMANLVKAKKQFSFKIYTTDGYKVVIYPKGNILKYRPIFAKAGCKF
jgi:hypothetical protein